MLDSLLTFAAGWSTDQIWEDLEVMRANDPKAAPDLPATKAELLRALRHAKAAGVMVEVDGVWKPGRPLVKREPQGQLF